MVVKITTMPLFLGDIYSSPQRKKHEVCNLFLKVHQKKPQKQKQKKPIWQVCGHTYGKMLPPLNAGTRQVSSQPPIQHF